MECLTAAIKGLGSSLRKHLSFAVLDIEADPSVPPSAAKYPAGFPKLVKIPHTYGGWSGYADIEQREAATWLT